MKHISDMLKSLGDAGVQRTMEAVSKRMEADPEFYKKVMQMKDELLKDPVKMAEIQKSMQDSGLINFSQHILLYNIILIKNLK